HVAAPFGKELAAVDDQIARVPGRRPRSHRIDVTFDALRAERRLGAVVMLALRDQYPAVVVARLDAIQLVAAARTELGRPQLARLGIEAKAGRIAVPERVELRQIALHPDERIVFGDRAVVVHADDLAEMRLRVLRLLAPVAIAARDVEAILIVERDPCAVAARGRTLTAAAVVLRRHRGAVPVLRDEHVLDVPQGSSAVPASARDGERRQR